jgi:hypothetical protein
MLTGDAAAASSFRLGYLTGGAVELIGAALALACVGSALRHRQR